MLEFYTDLAVRRDRADDDRRAWFNATRAQVIDLDGQRGGSRAASVSAYRFRQAGLDGNRIIFRGRLAIAALQRSMVGRSANETPGPTRITIVRSVCGKPAAQAAPARGSMAPSILIACMVCGPFPISRWPRPERCQRPQCPEAGPARSDAQFRIRDHGAAGGFLVILLWVYYSSEIFLVGAEFTRAYSVPTWQQVRSGPFGAFR